ncbi:tetratricopeptide repeat protein [Longimonas halophila]|nr:tetratricopeptide repeat protein [Longimonas halophila]
MATSVSFSYRSALRSLAVASLALFIVAAFTALPSLAQSEGGNSAMQQLEQSYRQGMQAGQQGNHEVAYNNLSEAIELAAQEEQENARRQIQDNLTRMAKNWGNDALENENYEDALMHFETGAEYASEDAYFYYGMGVAQLRLENEDEAMQHMQESIRIGEENGDQRTVSLATDRIRDEYVARASASLSKDNVTSSDIEAALEALDTLEEYVDPSDRSYFYRAVALFEDSDYEGAIENARQGLELHSGSRSDAARYHFVIAESQFQSGDTEAACSTFEDAAYGDYRARAQHYLENECE